MLKGYHLSGLKATEDGRKIVIVPYPRRDGIREIPAQKMDRFIRGYPFHRFETEEMLDLPLVFFEIGKSSDQDVGRIQAPDYTAPAPGLGQPHRISAERHLSIIRDYQASGQRKIRLRDQGGGDFLILAESLFQVFICNIQIA
jgi:hypothetical protein